MYTLSHRSETLDTMSGYDFHTCANEGTYANATILVIEMTHFPKLIMGEKHHVEEMLRKRYVHFWCVRMFRFRHVVGCPKVRRRSRVRTKQGNR